MILLKAFWIDNVIEVFWLGNVESEVGDDKVVPYLRIALFRSKTTLAHIQSNPPMPPFKKSVTPEAISFQLLDGHPLLGHRSIPCDQ